MTRQEKAPIHLWIIGIIAVLWNLMGVYDYLMTETHNEAYMARFNQEQLDYFYGFPVWAVSTWAVAVWGGLAGTVLLLLRRRQATIVFLVSLLAMIATTVYSLGFTNGPELMGAGTMVFTAVIFVTSLGLWLYARAMSKRGILV